MAKDRRAYHREWRKKNRAKVRDYEKRSLAKTDPDRKMRRAAYARADAKRAARRVGKPVRAIWLKYRYGITHDDYDKMLQKQGGACAICRKPPSGRAYLSVDHCHATSKVRGLLCRQCNCALGNVREDLAVLRRLAAYIKKHRP